ncbi:MAG: alpha/beta hydrolase [Cyclobacteriaceae bacterium]
MKLLKGFFALLLIVILLLVLGYFMGPKPAFDDLVTAEISITPFTLEEVDSIFKNEPKPLNLKPDNGSRLYWADSIPQKTKYVVVYLHGFSASPEEGDPLHINFAKRYGYNLYVPLLAGHGIDSKESFATIQPNDWIESAKDAINLAQSMGEDIIVISCSTGSTLALYLSSENEEIIDANFMYSPNISIANPMAKLVTGPWGKELTYQVQGKFKTWKVEGEAPNEKDKYWTHTYRSEGIIALQKLIDLTMTKEVLEKVTQPYFLGYYYKNDTAQDQTVSVEAMRWFDSISNTPEGQKQFTAFPNAGRHVMTSAIQSDIVDEVSEKSYEYAESVLGLTPLK